MRGRLVGLGILIVIALVISYFSEANRDDAGVVTKSGDVSAAEVQVGDCFDDLSQFSEASSTFTSVHAVPCNEAHSWQAFHESESTLESYSEGDIKADAEAICDSATQSLIYNMSSIKYDAFKNSQIQYFFPTYKSWTLKGDRKVQCLLGSDDETYFTSVFD